MTKEGTEKIFISWDPSVFYLAHYRWLSRQKHSFQPIYHSKNPEELNEHVRENIIGLHCLVCVDLVFGIGNSKATCNAHGWCETRATLLSVGYELQFLYPVILDCEKDISHNVHNTWNSPSFSLLMVCSLRDRTTCPICNEPDNMIGLRSIRDNWKSVSCLRLSQPFRISLYIFHPPKQG